MRISDYGTFPVVSPSDELTTVETSYGPMEKWKARALAIGWFSAVTHSRSDADEAPLQDKPPRLVADEAEFETAFANLMGRMRNLREVQDMIKQCDALEARCDALSRLRTPGEPCWLQKLNSRRTRTTRMQRGIE